MIQPFDPTLNLVVIPIEIFGPLGSLALFAGLDTGCTGLLIDPRALQIVGYDLSNSTGQVTVTTASQSHVVGRYRISKLHALGEDRNNVSVIGHQLPSRQVDALIGLDFFRGRVLKIDFAQGEIELT